MITVEVAYGLPDKQSVIVCEVADNSTVETAIHASKICLMHPEINLQTQVIGIFSIPVTLNTRIQSGDRIEIYRPLFMDPKQKRKLRVNSQKTNRDNKKK
jgi:uncharacterized protein